MGLGGSLRTEMVIVDLISSQQLDVSVIALHILIVEHIPEEISLLLPHLEHLLRYNPFKKSVPARRNRA